MPKIPQRVGEKNYICMKKFFIYFLFAGLLLTMYSCGNQGNLPDSIEAKKTTLEDVLPFPFPSHWGVTMSEFKADIQKQGYKIIEEGTEGDPYFAISYEIYTLFCQLNEDGRFAYFSVGPVGKSDSSKIWEYLKSNYTEENHSIEEDAEHYLFLDKETKTWVVHYTFKGHTYYYIGSTVYGSEAYQEFLY